MAGLKKHHLVGYARASGSERKVVESLDVQIKALLAAGVPNDRIHTDRLPGPKRAKTGIQAAIEDLPADGAYLVAWRLDRLGDSVTSVLKTVEKVFGAGADLLLLEEGIDTYDDSDKRGSLLAAIAKMERDLAIERALAGQEKLRASGGRAGRSPVMTPERTKRAEALLAKNMSKKAIAKELGISRASLYNWLARRSADSLE